MGIDWGREYTDYNSYVAYREDCDGNKVHCDDLIPVVPCEKCSTLTNHTWDGLCIDCSKDCYAWLE